MADLEKQKESELRKLTHSEEKLIDELKRLKNQTDAEKTTLQDKFNQVFY